MTATTGTTTSLDKQAADNAGLSASILPRRSVQQLGVYSPPLEGRRKALRLDFNENTEGFPQHYPGDLPVDWFTVYPEYKALIRKIATCYNLQPEQILLCKGSDEALVVVPNTFIEPGEDRLLHCEPTFPMIIHSARLADPLMTSIALNPDLTYPLERMEAALEATPHKLAIIASPDNPTGAMLPKETLFHWCKRFPDTLFMLDEAYSEYMGPDFTALPRVNDFPNLIVTRTFSKAWGLAGLRLGFVVAHPQLIAYMKRVRSPYSVNQMAVESGLRLLDNKTEILQKAVDSKARRDVLITSLREDGYQVMAGGGNFFLLRLGLLSKVFERFLAAQGILVRDRSGHPLTAGTVRVNTGTMEENQRFLEALATFRKTTALVFDLDDTLVDTSQSYDVAVAFVVRKYSDMPLGKNELKLLRAEGGFNDDWVAAEELLRRRGVTMPMDVIVAEGERVYFNLAEETETPLFAPDTLEKLQARFPLYIFTGRKQHEYSRVWESRLGPYFKHVLCTQDVEGLQPKPSPDYLLHLKAHEGLEQGVYIGNSVDDMRAAAAAGFLPVGITQTHTEALLREAGAVACFPSVNDLVEALAL